MVWLVPLLLRAQSPDYLNTDIPNLQQLNDQDLVALEALLDNPVDLNQATVSDLWFLDDSLVALVLSARDREPFVDWQDFINRTQLSPAQAQVLQQYSYIRPPQQVGVWLSTRIVNSASDERIRTRMNLASRTWTAQWVVQRDPGEYNLTDMSDISITVERGSTKAVLGAHRLSIGAGLVLAEEFPAPRGESLLRPNTRLGYLRPGYSNANLGVLRGFSIHHMIHRIHLIAGFGSQLVDIAPEPDGKPRVITHRVHTGPGLTSRETLPYLAITSPLIQWDIGVLTSWQALKATSTTAAAQRQVFSVFARRTFKNSFGEWHVSHETAAQVAPQNSTLSVRKNGHLTRLTFIGSRSPDRESLRLTILHRYYPPGWTPLRGYLIGDQVSQGNEQGLFIGWQWRWASWKVNGYLDGFHEIESPIRGAWRRAGWESGLAVNCKSRRQEMVLFYRHRESSSPVNTPTPDGLDDLQREWKASDYLRWRLDLNRSQPLAIRLMASVMMNDNAVEPGRGETLGAGIRYRHRSGTILTIGCHGFRTDGWDCRLYVFEDGLPGEFNFRALHGQGIRIHGKLALRIGESLISCRLAQQRWRSDPNQDSPRSRLYAGVQMDIAL